MSVRCPHCNRHLKNISQLSNCGFCSDKWRGCIVCYYDKHRPTHEQAKDIDTMPIIVKNTGGSDFEPAPAGVWAARCCDVRDLGIVKSHFQGKEIEAHKVLVSWVIAEERDDGKPFLVSKRYTASLHEKSNLRKELASWRGRDFTEVELDGFDLENLIGAPALLNVVHAKSPDGTKTYANVTSVSPVPKAMKGEIPKIPLDFKRFVEREKEESAGSEEPPPPDDSDLPF